MNRAEREILQRAADCAWGTWTLGTSELAAGRRLEEQGFGRVVGEDTKGAMRHFQINERGREAL